ncbi:cytochrome c biogenesis protein CcsA [Ferrimonas sediminicola]|uniref:cytochrome c biogenesis protein CcsA n=1 Tax=Ferrimonas sediminicola TaxID=2569538 RepID=UPI00145FC93B|nr:cytochrome c biogenesis protein CcsA [Ferrimonas sediminicola]
MVGLGWILHSLSLLMRWLVLGHGPFVTLFEVLSGNLWSLVLAWLVAWCACPRFRGGWVAAMPVLALMGVWIPTTPAEGSVLPATFYTPWLYVHSLTGRVFLAALMLALGLVLAQWLSARSDRLVPLSVVQGERAVDALLLMALLFDGLMLVSGAIWAENAWGQYWGWDPLEVWALITWLMVGLAIHVRLVVPSGPGWSLMAVAAAFAVAFVTFFGVPFLSMAPHMGVF